MATLLEPDPEPFRICKESKILAAAGWAAIKVLDGACRRPKEGVKSRIEREPMQVLLEMMTMFYGARKLLKDLGHGEHS